MSGILLNDDTTTTVYCPHNGDVNKGWGTGIQAYNPSATDCDTTITPYTMAGDALTPVEDTIGGKEQYSDLVSRLGFSLDTAWLKVDAASPIIGFELFAKLEKNGATGI